MKKTNFIANILREIKLSLITPKHEPQIKQKSDRYGNLYWQVYDFTSNKLYTFGSEGDVRNWLDERYHSC